jgi:hypothetical protein
MARRAIDAARPIELMVPFSRGFNKPSSWQRCASVKHSVNNA